MAEVTRSLRFVDAKSGSESDRLEVSGDGSFRTALAGYGGIASGVLSASVRYEEETEAAAFAFLATNGWPSTVVMIDLDDLGRRRR